MERLEIKTKAHAEFHEITADVQGAVARSKVKSGIAHVFVPHTTAGLTINENADPDVALDILETLDRMVPWRQAHYRHTEGNSAAHIKASMMGFTAAVPVVDGELAMGMWQAIYLCEFDGPRTRQVWVRVVGGR
jgi:secondary thiamine-phosphate synthase enzyme